MLRKILSLVSNYDPKYRTRTVRRLARGVPRDEGTREIPERAYRKWTEVPRSELDDASYVQRLEEEERIRRARATKLSEQHERMGRKYKEIPDPWFN